MEAALSNKNLSFVSDFKECYCLENDWVPHGNETPYFLAEWAHIRLLGVLPQYRGLGIAGALMQQCINQAIALDEHTLALHTAEYQEVWRIYERLGFQRVKTIEPIYEQVYWLYQLSQK